MSAVLGMVPVVVLSMVLASLTGDFGVCIDLL
jgi:hypothetical protein